MTPCEASGAALGRGVSYGVNVPPRMSCIDAAHRVHLTHVDTYSSS